jgi:hypothetical protein
MSTETRGKIKSKALTKPYSNMSYGTEPGPSVRFARRCIILQIYQFFHLNFKVMRIVLKGHS